MSLPSNGRGPWYLFSLVNPVILLLALNGLFGSQAAQESEAAREDWTRAVSSTAGRTILGTVAVAVAIVVVLLVYNRP